MDATYTWKFYFMYGIPLTHTSVIKTYTDIHIITNMATKNVSISQQGTYYNNTEYYHMSPNVVTVDVVI